MSWTFAPVFDAAHRAALSDGKNLIYVCPPAAWAAEPLFARLLPTGGCGVSTLILIPDPTAGLDVLASTATLTALEPSYSATGISRTGRLLQTDAIRTLIATPTLTVELLKRSSLKLDRLERVAVLWPESEFALDAAAPIDTVLAECGGAQRLIVTADDASIRDFIERHARRAPVVSASRPPETLVGPARYAVVDGEHVAGAVRATLDSLNPSSALIWDPTPPAEIRWAAVASDPTVRVASDPGGDPIELALAVALPSVEVLTALRAVASNVVVLLRATQLPYLQRLAHPLSTLRISGEVDRARGRAFDLRAALRARIDDACWSHDLLALAPLFDEYDPAVVAAAAVRLSETGPRPDRMEAEELPAWVRIHINAGKRDRIRTADLVGALINAVGVSKNHVGRVEVREAHALVEVRAEEAGRVLRGLDGLTVRGRRVAARIDRR